MSVFHCDSAGFAPWSRAILRLRTIMTLGRWGVPLRGLLCLAAYGLWVWSGSAGWAGESGLREADGGGQQRNGELVPGTWTPVPVNWRSGTVDWRGQFGRREALLCPPRGILHPIFGTDIYTDDSSICTAALHAGVLSSREAGGIVAVEIRPDPMQYLGTLQNGIASDDWFDHWPSGFVFLRSGDGAAPAPAVAAHARTSAEAWPDSIGRVVSVLCPPKVELLSVFGTDWYTDDTPICSAAVHASRTTHEMGGVVSIVIRPGKPSYPGSSRHGIASMTAESRPASFEFVETPPNTPLPPTLTTPFLRSSGRLEPSVPLR